MIRKSKASSLTILLAAALWDALATAAAASERSGPSPPRPNIVFIIADDLGINDLACYGRKDHSTPNLDRLAGQGMRFTTAYAAQSVCSPSRAAILTGKSPARLHLTTFLPGRPDTVAQMLLHPKIEQQLPRGEKTIAGRLKSAGYVSAVIGKWHLGGKGSLPTDHGFDEYFPGHAVTKPSAREGGKGEYELTARAEQFIQANKDRPFFLYLAHNNPHVPLAAKAELIEKNKNAFNPVYAAMIETLDDCVGRIVAKLKELGLENTLIVFTSDNGGLHVLEGPFTPATYFLFRGGKGFCFEGGLRIPLIVRWTGKVKAGQVVDTPVIGTDWTPTLLAVAGLQRPEQLDGVSLLPLLSEGKAPVPRALYWHQPHYTNQGGRPAGAIRESAWKLNEDYETGRCELFDLAEDLREATDLAGREPARVADLRGKLEKWRRDAGTQENQANPRFNAKLWRQFYGDVDASRLPPAEKAATLAQRLEPWRVLMNDVLPGNKGAGRAGPGAVILHARTATVHGSKLHYEPQPHKDTLGFWVQKDDWVEWEFDLPSAGVFEVELLQACGKGSGGSEVEVAIKGQALTMKVAETGHFQRFVPITIGTVRLQAGRTTLSVRAKSRPSPAVMDLRRVVLRGCP